MQPLTGPRAEVQAWCLATSAADRMAFSRPLADALKLTPMVASWLEEQMPALFENCLSVRLTQHQDPAVWTVCISTHMAKDTACTATRSPEPMVRRAWLVHHCTTGVCSGHHPDLR